MIRLPQRSRVNDLVWTALEEAGVDVIAKKRLGWPLLSTAADAGHGAAVAALVVADADVDEQDSGGLTALDRAVSAGQAEIVATLVAATSNQGPINSLIKKTLEKLTSSSNPTAVPEVPVMTPSSDPPPAATTTRMTGLLDTLGKAIAYLDDRPAGDRPVQQATGGSDAGESSEAKQQTHGDTDGDDDDSDDSDEGDGNESGGGHDMQETVEWECDLRVLDARTTTEAEFRESVQEREPVVFSHVADGWPAMESLSAVSLARLGGMSAADVMAELTGRPATDWPEGEGVLFGRRVPLREPGLLAVRGSYAPLLDPPKTLAEYIAAIDTERQPLFANRWSDLTDAVRSLAAYSSLLHLLRLLHLSGVMACPHDPPRHHPAHSNRRPHSCHRLAMAALGSDRQSDSER